MNRIVDYRSEASTSIASMTRQLEGISKVLNEKKGNNSRGLRIFLNIIYIAGVMACITWGLLYKDISLAHIDVDFGYFVIIMSAGSSAVFFSLLLLRNLLDARYYKTVYDEEVSIAKITRHLEKVKSESSKYYGLLSDSNGYIDYTIELGEDLDRSIDSTKSRLDSLEKGKSNVIGGILSAVYYVSAISVGAFIMLLIQNAFTGGLASIIVSFGAKSDVAKSWSDGIYSLCSILAVFLGPILTKYYFNSIKLKTLNDTLIFLIAGSTVVAFIIEIIAVGIIAGVIALIVVIVQTILAILAAIFGVLIIIAIVLGLLNGG